MKSMTVFLLRLTIAATSLKRTLGCWLIKDFPKQLCKVIEGTGIVWCRRVVSEEEFKGPYRGRIIEKPHFE